MPGLFASVDTAFVLNLESGCKPEIEAFERLRLAGHAIRITPVVSHELMALVEKGGVPGKVAAAFAAKSLIYGIQRLELDGVQKDCAKSAAEALIAAKLLNGNVAHLVGESSCRENCFLISDLSPIKKADWKEVQRVVDGTHIHPIRRFSVNDYLKA